MPGVELSISSCDGHLAVALRGELDASAEAASRLTISPAWPSGGLVRASRPASRVPDGRGAADRPLHRQAALDHAFTMLRLTDVACDFVNGATAEIPSRHGTNRAVSTHNQKEARFCNPTGTAATAVNCRARYCAPVRKRKIPSPRRTIARCRPTAKEIRRTGPHSPP